MKKRCISLDILRVYASLGVVAIHADVITDSSTNYIGGASWWVVNLIHILSRVSVPIFIMVAGYLHLSPNKSNNWINVIVKVAKRYAIPLVFWTIFTFWWYVNLRWQVYSAEDIISRILSGQLFHLYFIIALVGLLLVTTVLKQLIYKINDGKDAKRLVIALLSLSAVNELFIYIFSLSLFNFSVFMWIPYLGYYLVGSYARSKNAYVSWKITLPVVFSLISINAILRYQVLSGSNVAADYFTSHFNIFIMMASILIFLTLSNQTFNNLWYKQIAKITPLTFGIYLIHPFVLDSLDHYASMAVHLVTGNLLLYYLKKILFAYIISAMITFLLLKLPVISRLVKHL